jgi:hypothetical protein
MPALLDSSGLLLIGSGRRSRNSVRTRDSSVPDMARARKRRPLDVWVGRKPTARLRASRSRQGREARQLKEAEEKTLLSEWISLLKKCLTGPTLLEMSGNATYQVYWTYFRVALALLTACRIPRAGVFLLETQPNKFI